MRRTQLYLDDQLWNTLHARARTRKTTVSELVREAVRDYLGIDEDRTEAMLQFVGSRKVKPGHASAVEEVRRLRGGSRLDRLSGR
jgi:metal-responsive CopG/Arc/MetJ family transcriptional regulator